METTTKIPIKGGEFIIRTQSWQEVFTPEDFTEEQLMMANACTEFIDKEVLPQRHRFEEKDYDFTLQIMKKLGELGMLGISVPEEYGGLGMGFNTSMLVCDRISGISGSLSTAYGAHTGIGTLPILLYGTEEQKKKYLPKLATGEWMGAYCLTEPGAGSDANSGKTRAVWNEADRTWSITGQKMWISNAGFADLFIVFARIEDDKYITGFIVERGTPGMSFGEEENKLGIRASSTRQVFFNDCKIPAENMLGERGGGFKIAMNALNVGRIKLAAAVMDSCRRVTSLAVKYANERIQFGVPISSFGAIQQKLADMATRSWASESATYRAGQDIEDNIARLEASGLSPQEAKLKGVEEYAIECAILKVHGSETGSFVADEGVQIYGGMGYSADTPMEAAYRDVRIARIYEGTNEINRMLSVGMLLRRALKGQLDLMTPAMKVASELMAIPSFDTLDYSQPLAQELEIINNLKKAFLMVAGKAVEKFGMNVEDEQEVLMNAADILIETYVAESAVLRALKILNTKGEEAAKYPIKMAQLYTYLAVEKIQKAAREAIYSFTEGDEQRILLMGLKRFTKYQQPVNPKALRREIAVKLIAEGRYCF
ncbi:acyl-CoA dehydrogenase family protein [Thermaurantimonas aggregans]|uniref:acyl-CoA dehydrogenase family protein n=1 Tax=Thermaurantimonas aggregans TaxID=2173829 RepID=UPI0023F2B964|nr:acyl-CoA dehydrogenase family protein [Thermaurantimonas aggregans]MCX8147955.1 acyl-CoA dehydrogenase family protein [Thermaurantimonas aggregans]